MCWYSFTRCNSYVLNSLKSGVTRFAQTDFLLLMLLRHLRKVSLKKYSVQVLLLLFLQLVNFVMKMMFVLSTTTRLVKLLRDFTMKSLVFSGVKRKTIWVGLLRFANLILHTYIKEVVHLDNLLFLCLKHIIFYSKQM